MKRIIISLAMTMMLASPNAQTNETQHIKEQLLSQYDYDEKTLNVLAEKLLRGEQLDCMKEEYSDMEPNYASFRDGEYHALYIYPDGSAAVLSVTGGTIAQGTYSSGGNWYTWNNALVSGGNGIVRMQFQATFSGSQYDATISSVSNGYVYLSGNKDGTLSIINGHVTSGSASAMLSYSSYSLTLNVPVGNNNPTAILSY